MSKIPVYISPYFWVTAGLIGLLNGISSGQILTSLVVWVLVIFISILVHEYGHAIASYSFGQKPRIELVPFGGVTIPEGKSLKGWREFVVILSGPLFGFLLFLLSLYTLSTESIQNPFLLYLIEAFTWVNLFWTGVNLVPVLPLDGGQLLRVILESLFGEKGLTYTHAASILFSALAAMLFFSMGYFLVGVILFLFFFQNLEGYRRSKIAFSTSPQTFASRSLEEEKLTESLRKAEELISQNRIHEAIPLLEELRLKTKTGMVYRLTTQQLASLKIKQELYAEVYQLLLPLKGHLIGEASLHLHKAAYEMGDYAVVNALGGKVYQLLPDPQIAVMNGEASATQGDVKATVGWIRAAQKGGVKGLLSILEKKNFDPVREDPTFKELIQEESGN